MFFAGETIEDTLQPLFFTPPPDELYCLQDPDHTGSSVLSQSRLFHPPPPCPAKSMMSPPVAMAECGASRNMPERGRRRRTEDELLQCFEGHAETAHTVRSHAGREGRVEGRSARGSLNMRERPRIFAVRCDYLSLVNIFCKIFNLNINVTVTAPIALLSN